MTKVTTWICEGCETELREEPAHPTVKISGTMLDREWSGDLCGKCMNRLNSGLFPDWWVRDAAAK